MNEVPKYYKVWSYDAENELKWSYIDLEMEDNHYPQTKRIIVHSWEEFLNQIGYIKNINTTESVFYSIKFQNNKTAKSIPSNGLCPAENMWVCYDYSQIEDFLERVYGKTFDEDDFILFEKYDESNGIYRIKDLNENYLYIQYCIENFYEDFQNIEQDSIEIPCNIDFNGFTLKNLKFKTNCGFLISNQKMLSNLICLNLQIDQNNENGIFYHVNNMIDYTSIFHEITPVMDHCYLDIDLGNKLTNFTLINYPTNNFFCLSNSIINLKGDILGNFKFTTSNSKVNFYHNILNFDLIIRGNWASTYNEIVLNCCELNGHLEIMGSGNIYLIMRSSISKLNTDESSTSLPDLIGYYYTNIYRTNYNPTGMSSNKTDEQLINISQLFSEEFPIAEKTINKNNSKKNNLISPQLTRSGINVLDTNSKTYNTSSNIFHSGEKKADYLRNNFTNWRTGRYGDIAQSYYINEKWLRDSIIYPNGNIKNETILFNNNDGTSDFPNLAKDQHKPWYNESLTIENWHNHWPFMQSIGYGKYIFTFFMMKVNTALTYDSTLVIPELFIRTYVYQGQNTTPTFYLNHKGLNTANKAIFSLQSQDPNNEEAISAFGTLDANSSLEQYKIIRDSNTNGYTIYKINCPADGKMHGFYFAFDFKNLESLETTSNPSFIYPALYFIPGPAYNDNTSTYATNERFINFMLKEGDINDPENIDFTYSHSDRRMQFTVENDKPISTTRLLLGSFNSPVPPPPPPPVHKKPVYYTVPNNDNPSIIEKIVKIYDYYDTLTGIQENATLREYDYLPPQI